MSALFSHNRAHYREQEQFYCSFPGCNKQYDKACRLKIHMRSHTGIHRDDLYTGQYMEHSVWKVDCDVLEKLKVRKGDIRYLESVKAFDSWPSGDRSPLNEAVICKAVKDMQSHGFCHCAFCSESQLYSQVHRCSKRFTLDTNSYKTLRTWNVCAKVWNSKKINFSSGKHT